MGDAESIPLEERLLVSAAVIISFFLTILTLPRKHPRHALIECVFVTAFYYFTFILMIASLILLNIEAISLDAFACAFIGLGPAVLAIVRASELQDRASALNAARKRPSLHADVKQFRYLRHGRPPSPRQLKNERTSDASVYIRRARSAESTGQSLGEMWHGDVIDLGRHVVHLQDKGDIGDAVRWWKRLNKFGISIVEQPQHLLPDREAALRALQLLAEICAIGDAVLHYFESDLRDYLRNKDMMRQSLNASPKAICNEILKNTALPWGDVDEDAASDFGSRRLDRGRKYGVLFFILLAASEMFSKAKQDGQGRKVVGADEVIELYESTADEAERKRILGSWLSRWGLEPKELNVTFP